MRVKVATLVAVVLVAVVVGVLGASPASATPTPSASLTVNSIGRTTSGQLSYDVNVDVSGWEGSDACYWAGCQMYLEFAPANGSSNIVEPLGYVGGDPYSHEYTGTLAATTVTGVYLYVTDHDSLDAPFSSAAVPITTDTYPSAPQASVTVNSIGRTSDGLLSYDVTAAVAGWANANTCTYGTCDMYLEFVLADGSGNVAEPVGTVGDLDPNSHDYTGTLDTAAVSGVFFYVSDHDSYDTPISSAVAPITTDPYPTSAYASLVVHSIGRTTDGTLSFDVTASVSGWEHSAACVLGGCQMVLDFVSANGGTYPNQSLVYLGSSDPYSHEYTGTVTAGAVTGAYLTVTDNDSYDTPFRSPVIPLTGSLASEEIGGSNPSTKNCGCSRGDPVDTESGEFYQNDTDLQLPGSGPSFAVSRSYSSEDAGAAGSFGYGWTSDMDTHLSFGSANSSGMPVSVEVVQENGSTVTFYLNSSNQYVAPPWVLASMTYSSSTGQWSLVRRAADTLVFDADGYLASESNPAGDATDYARNSSHQVTSMSAAGGRSFTFTWASTHITGVTDSAGRTVTYGYDGSNELTSVTDPVGYTTHYTYATGHYLATLETRNGGTTTNTYNTSHQVTTQTDPLGRATTFSYDGTSTTTTSPGGSETVYTYSAGALISEVDGYGTASAATTTYTYDGAGNMLSSTDPEGNATSYTYDSAGNTLTKTDPLANTTTYAYDALNGVTSVTDPLGRETNSTYDSSGNRLTTTSPGGNEQQWTYNTDGTVATSIDARGKTTSYEYNSAGDLTSTTDPDERTKSIGYNDAGFPTSSTDPAGKETDYTVDALGRVLTSTDPNSHTTTNTYDADGNLLSTEDPNSHTASKAYDLADEVTSTTDARGKTTTYTYTDAGKLATTTDPDSHTSTNTWNVLGELVSTEDADGHTTTYTYDADGRKLTTTLPSGDASSTAYDADGRATSTTDAKGKVTTIAYDADGELTSSTDPLSRVTSTSYTADGQVHVVTLPDSSTETYTYNADGQTTQFTNADGKNTAYSFDDADLLISKVEPGGLETDYSYNSAGLLHVTTLPDSTTQTDSYNDAGQLSRVHSSVSGSTDIAYAYDAAGQRTSTTDETGTTSYSYNADGQATSVENGAGTTVGYGYDNAGLMTSIVYPGGQTVTYGYDADGQITSLTDWSSNETDFTWTSDGQLATETDPGGVTETRSYDADDQTTGIADTKSGTTLADYTYGYDNAGDISSDGTTDPIGTASHSYAYDPNSQLTTVTTGGTSTAYAASSAGQITADTNGNTLAYNTAQELTGLTPSTGPATSYTYDGNGSRTASTVAATGGIPSATTSYSYDPEGDLASVTPPGVGGSISYTSDGDGLRQTRTVAGTTTDFTWDVSGSLPLLLNDGTHSYIYGPSSAPIAQVDDSTGAIQYLHGDLIGSTRLITNASGTVVGTTEYDPYGNRTNHTGTADTTIGYSGNWTDPTTGLVYLRARDYDTATAQFLTVDRLVDTTRQPYAYVADNPLNNSDPTGLCDKSGFPNFFQFAWAFGVVQFDNIANDSVLHSIVNAYASFGNAMINHPDLAWQLILGVAGTVGGGAGEVGLGACDVTFVGTVPCVAGGIVLGGAIAGSAAYAGNAATQLANDAAGSDRVEPWQNEGSDGLAQTDHGATRAADPSRLDPTAQEDVVANPTSTYTQVNGDGSADVYVQEVGGKYNVVVKGNDGVITNLKTISAKSLNNLAKNYGWIPN